MPNPNSKAVKSLGPPRRLLWKRSEIQGGRLITKFLINSGEFVLPFPWIWRQIHLNVVIKIFAISLSSQPFLGCHLRLHIFFHNSLLGGYTLLRMGCFELEWNKYCIRILVPHKNLRMTLVWTALKAWINEMQNILIL